MTFGFFIGCKYNKKSVYNERNFKNFFHRPTRHSSATSCPTFNSIKPITKSDKLILDLNNHSHLEVVKKLPKKEREEYLHFFQ